MSKRLTRKKLKQKDEFLTTLEKLLKVASTNRSYLVVAGIVLLFSAIFLSIGFYYYKDYSKKGSVEYFRDLQLYEIAQRTNKKEDITNALNAFTSFKDKYKLLKISKLAFLYMGNCEYMLGDYDTAITDYKTLVSDLGEKQGYISAIADNGIVQAYIAKKDCTSAMPLIDTLLNHYNNVFMRLTYVHAVDCYLESKQPEKAVELLDKGLKRYKDNKDMEQQLANLMAYVKANGQSNIINFKMEKF
ncbi:MAG: tetratricopeptide repeat protein [Deltaproteobacteria bacterium]|nr:tetratricopeptide repeat protein [Deltaproteobacteria bacterium]MCL5278061.1 tetratricopeptide repeat protein [Deltaproteobacteria bacterium]